MGALSMEGIQVLVKCDRVKKQLISSHAMQVHVPLPDNNHGQVGNQTRRRLTGSKGN
ncbi:hypothetical protein SAY87_015649 [Trapa incisa]|uniref:Uncharacterized protein n=1 Tax=Trapa incisa TaxID=236973 RepID=A0AAN7LAZ6_9MYRT|nr:hypothetical protein SAY87_015649 [Trapa incisa]